MLKTPLGAHLMDDSPWTSTAITLKQRSLARGTKATATWSCQPTWSLCDASQADLDWMALSRSRYVCLHACRQFITWLQSLSLWNLRIPNLFHGPYVMPTLPACKTLYIKLFTQWPYDIKAKEPTIVVTHLSELGKFFPAVETMDIGHYTAPWDCKASAFTLCCKMLAHTPSTRSWSGSWGTRPSGATGALCALCDFGLGLCFKHSSSQKPSTSFWAAQPPSSTSWSLWSGSRARYMLSLGGVTRGLCCQSTIMWNER